MQCCPQSGLNLWPQAYLLPPSGPVKWIRARWKVCERKRVIARAWESKKKRENVWVRERLWEYVYSRRYTPLCTVHSELRLDSGPINKLVQFCNVSVRTPPYAPTSCVLDRENEKDKMIYLFYFLSRHCHSGKFQMHCVPVIPLSFWTQTNEIVYF